MHPVISYWHGNYIEQLVEENLFTPFLIINILPPKLNNLDRWLNLLQARSVSRQNTKNNPKLYHYRVNWTYYGRMFHHLQNCPGHCYNITPWIHETVKVWLIYPAPTSELWFFQFSITRLRWDTSIVTLTDRKQNNPIQFCSNVANCC